MVFVAWLSAFAWLKQYSKEVTFCLGMAEATYMQKKLETKLLLATKVQAQKYGFQLETIAWLIRLVVS
jgi:hypothetical protein